MIPYGHQNISEEDIEAVTTVLRSQWLTQGPATPQFEQAVGDYCGATYGVAFNSATTALHIACRALGLGAGDWLWTSPNSFVASANCGLYCGAKVDFVDIDSQTYNMSVDELAIKLGKADAEGNLPKIVIPVHFAGQPCDMRGINALARQYGFHIIEDASHAIGGRYLGDAVGNCRYSDITVFSFHPVKIITTGEGGIALSNDPDLVTRMRQLRTHGITRDSEKLQRQSDGPWYYEQQDLGFNYRMTDIQAALGHSQLGRLDEFVAQRHRIAARYDEEFSELPLILPYRGPEVYSALHLYPIQVLETRTHTRAQVFDSMRTAGIGVNVHYIPIHTQPYYRELGFRLGSYPNAEHYYSRTLSLPLYPSLTYGQQTRVIEALSQALQ